MSDEISYASMLIIKTINFFANRKLLVWKQLIHLLYSFIFTVIQILNPTPNINYFKI